MDINLVDVAQYFPESSPFKSLVKELYGIDVLPDNSAGHLLTTRKILPEIELFRLEKNSPEAFEQGDHEDVNPQRDLFQSKKFQQSMGEMAENLRKIDKTDEEALSKINEAVDIASKKVESQFPEDVKDIVKTVIAGLIVATLTLPNATAIPKVSPNTYIVNTRHDNLNVRSSAEITGDKSNVLFSIPRGSVVNKIGESGDFYEVDCKELSLFYEKQQCFVSKEHLWPVLSRGK